MSSLANPSAIPTLTVGGRVFTDLTNLIVLKASISAAGRYSTFRRLNGTAGYQVTAGKTLTIVALRGFNRGAAVESVNLQYGNTDSGVESAVDQTGVVYESGAAMYNSLAFSATSGSSAEAPSGFTVPATKYPGVIGTTGSTVSVYAYCYEA